ncbi:MAG TPA: hypothetical protein ACFYD6_02360 [Candidatus Brocadiia bacterium]|nr:hypothetical protein [Candidatus Brocadiales bacterium]
MAKGRNFLLITLMYLSVLGCTRHEINVAPVEIKPIHITIDVNVKIDKALDDFFQDLDKAEGEIKAEDKPNNVEKSGTVEK